MLRKLLRLRHRETGVGKYEKERRVMEDRDTVQIIGAVEKVNSERRNMFGVNC